ncbi:putative lipid II flippase FtsW [Bacteriovorax sp. Seq25_V]|uniref:putative lipid II flippase FtsW n=1 Tax=Bacteriovorax sp. Seq25_V TaxID=1201288 RepID=UPI00038A3237|nr:putative lipid II flippase FtsW [Bacteriovorax sp. Seq25_V]EQC43207.1 cell division protein FtsW [Bacteriovorax sp. Seq25_V]
MEFRDNLEKYSGLLKITIGLLISIGVIMVYSASYMYSKEHYGSSLYFFIRQLGFATVALLGAFIVSKTKYQFWYKYSFYINIFVSFLIMLTYIPGLGVLAKGANRWIAIAGFSLQPGEFAKYSTLLLALYLFENFETLDLKKRIQYSLNLLMPLVLLILQPDFGTFFICSIGIFLACFISSFSRKVFYGLTGLGSIVGVMILFAQPYRVKRLTAFLDPWANAQGSGFQVIQSWIGFANGGFFGKGVGNSLEKLFYLPEAHNDFIFSVIGEEFGFLGVISMVGLFLMFVYLGLRLCFEMKDRVATQICVLIISIIGLQAALNMGVVLGLLPTKGLNLPFISYGGSSLLANILAVGLVFSCVNRSAELRSSESF